MARLRLSALLFLGALMIGVMLASCGREGNDGADRAASRDPLGIPGLQGVKSGELEATLRLTGAGEEGLYMRVLGTFLGAGEETLPQVDFAAEASGEAGGRPVDAFTALISTDDRAVLTYDGDTFETDPRTFATLRESFGRALGSGSPADLAACLKVMGQTPLSRLAGAAPDAIRTVPLKGSAGSVMSVDLEVEGMIAVLRRLEDDPGCGAQLRAAAPLGRTLAAVERDLEQGIGPAEARLTLDEKGTWQELSVHLGPWGHGESAREAEFLLRLTRVNEIDKLPPCHGERPLSALYRKLGFNPLELIESGAAGGVVGLLSGIYGRPGRASRA